LPSLPRGALEMLGNVGHMPHLENSQFCADVINKFLSNIFQV